MKARWFHNHACKNEEKLLERLYQAILDLIDNLYKALRTTAIRMLFWQTLYRQEFKIRLLKAEKEKKTANWVLPVGR